MKVDKRTTTFWNSATPLTSKRISIILGNQSDAEALVSAIIRSRNGGSNKFTVSQETLDVIEAYSQK